MKTNVTGEGEITGRFLEVMEEIAAGNKEAMREKAQKEIDTSVEKSKQNMGAVMGRSRGILSSIVNSVTSGNAFVSMAVALSSIVHSDNIAVVILIILVVDIICAKILLLEIIIGFMTTTARFLTKR